MGARGPKPGRITDNLQDSLISTNGIAFALDLTVARVSQLARQGMLFKERRGKFWILRSVRAYIQTARAGKVMPEAAPSVSKGRSGLKNAEKADAAMVEGLNPIERARYRKILAEAEKTELELLEAAGNLVSAESVTVAWEDMLSRIRAKILSIPKKVAPLVQDDQDLASIESRITEAIDEALSEASSYQLPAASVVDLPDSYAQAAPAADG